MKCPVDGAVLLVAERQNVEIDYCPECRGVWLDRGELDKLIRTDRDRYDDDREWRGNDRGPSSGYKKKKGFLSNIFEFGD